MAVQTPTQRGATKVSAPPQLTAFKGTLAPYYYVAPALLVMAVITFFPIVYMVYLSFRNLTALNLITGSQFVGFENYRAVLGSLGSEFYTVTLRTFLWTIINVFFHITLGVFLAIQLNKRGLRLAPVYRMFMILPWAVPTVVTALMFRTTLYDFNFGAINQALTAMGLSGVSWLQDATNAFIAVVIFNVWAGIPFIMLVAAGALKSIPDELYEAAVVDGASGMQQHWNITLPLLRPTMIPATILGIIWTFNNLLAVYLITQGGPSGKTDILLTYLYRQAFLDNNFLYSLASAITVVVFFILLAFVLLNVKISGAMKEEG